MPFFMPVVFYLCYCVAMWKIKLDEILWLAKHSEATRSENQAWLLPDMRSVQAQLIMVRRFMPYPNAMVIFDDDQAHQNHTPSG